MFILQDIAYDNDMEYDIKDNFLNIATSHFTEFMVKGKKKMDVSDVLLSVVAGFKSSTMVEFRLLAHVNCLRLKDFEHMRARVCKLILHFVHIEIIHNVTLFYYVR